jgi:hypothetical protein
MSFKTVYRRITILLFKMKRKLFTFLLCAFSINAIAQIGEKENPKLETVTDKIVKATEFSIPTSGAFTLLGYSPANVSTPGFTKDIKVDYFLDDFSLKPNIAFEFQPVWLFGLKNVSLTEYQKKGALFRFLSTANVSLGTHTENGISKIAYSLKLSFFKDPMKDSSYIVGVNNILIKQRDKRQKEQMSAAKALAPLALNINKMWKAIKAIRKITDSAERELVVLKANPIKYDDQIRKLGILIAANASDTIKYHVQIEADSSKLKEINASIQAQDTGYDEDLETELIAFAKLYKERNWAAPRLDIGAGKVDTYRNANLTQLGLKSNGFGLWANPSIGFAAGTATDQKEAAKILITGLFKYVESERVGQYFYGGNIRYGSSTLNLFAEYTYLKDGSDITNSLAYGGSYTIGSKKLIEFGIRTDYTKDFSFKSLIPVVAFNWKLGQDLFNK